MQVPNIVRLIAAEDILLMRHQTQFLWNTYFSSIEKIVSTTLEVIENNSFFLRFVIGTVIEV